MGVVEAGLNCSRGNARNRGGIIEGGLGGNGCDFKAGVEERSKRLSKKFFRC